MTSRLNLNCRHCDFSVIQLFSDSLFDLDVITRRSFGWHLNESQTDVEESEYDAVQFPSVQPKTKQRAEKLVACIV